MTTALWKNIFREIWNTKARFLSILAIVALGVGFFSGVKGTSPAMAETVMQYARNQNLMDLRLVSTVGFNDNDIKAISQTDNVDNVNAGFMADVMVGAEGSAKVYRIHSLPTKYSEENQMNKLVVTEGRLPQKTGEIVIQENQDFSVGDTLDINKTSGDTKTSDMLNHISYTIVGTVKSPMYMSLERGNTNIGTGKVSYFAYALPEEFKSQRYTEVYITTTYAKDLSLSPFSDEYTNSVKAVQDSLEQVGSTRISAFDTETLQPAREKLESGINEYNTQKTNADKELQQAEKALADAKIEYNNKIKEAQTALDDAQKEITNGESLLPYSITTYYEEILQAQDTLNAGKTQLSNSKLALQTAQSQYNTEVELANTALSAAQTAYDSKYYTFYTYTKPQSQMKIDTYSKLIASAEKDIIKIEEELAKLDIPTQELQTRLKDTKALLESYKNQLALGQQEITDGENQLASLQETLNNAKSQLETKKTEGKASIDAAQAQIDSAQTELDAAQTKFDTAKAEGKKQIDDAQSQLAQGKLSVEQGKIQLQDQKEQGKQQLDNGAAKLADAKTQAETKLSEAKAKLDDAQNKLDKISNPQWAIYTREQVSGFGSFYNDTQRVDAVAMVFPLFFLLVAVLVCLTTMTRLLEERRSEIGTLKGLGYTPAAIAVKYIIYSVAACVLGCVAGVFLGVSTLPYIIYNAYKMMYTTPKLILVIPWFYIIVSSIAALACTAGVAMVVCRKALLSSPAKLMRPKAPKPGKRILLEKINILWKHLSFTSKVTARNIFRYKARFLMTVLGVAGCTALIVAGFGLKDSINDVINKQFSDIFLYKGMIVPQNKGSEEDLQELTKFVEGYKGVDKTVLFNYAVDEIEGQDGSNVELDVFTPQSSAEMKKLINLHTRTTKQDIPLTDDGVVISEKLSNILNVNIGDNITYTADNKKYTVKVTGICENYIRNYAFMTPNYYKEIYGQDVKFNLILEGSDTMEKSDEDVFANQLLQRDDVMGVTFIAGTIDEYKDMMNSLNLIVYVMIICAGALAFVVLYNLTNINISERTREIATIKVLGFYNKEVTGYVYRENMVLTILGIAVGLVLGTFLSNYIVQTAEVDLVMFGRQINLASYLLAIGLTALFSLVVNAFMYFKMRGINMVNSLKSIE